MRGAAAVDWGGAGAEHAVAVGSTGGPAGDGAVGRGTAGVGRRGVAGGRSVSRGAGGVGVGGGCRWGDGTISTAFGHA